MTPIIYVNDSNRADNRFQDGALPHLTGVRSFQILRANRAHPEQMDGVGWTYNHAAMLAWGYGRFFCEYLSNPVDEHEVPGHTLLSQSVDGMTWSRPVIAFPEVEVPTAQYKGPRSPLLKDKTLTVAHQRMGFYYAKNGVLLALAFYGIVHDCTKSAPCDGWGVGRAVRRIREDGSLGENIYFLIYNEPAGYTAENTPVFAPYQTCPEEDFVAACDELLQNGAVVRQMYEEQRFDKTLFPTPGAEALSFYTDGQNEMIGMYKKSLVSVSTDGGKTWTPPAYQPSIHTASGKVWGQKTSDGRYTLMYNPTSDGQHRWPIAAVTGEDGHCFGHLCTLTGDMSPQRYGGRDKNLGPQYMRGIAECNPQALDGAVWLVYSNNKEDIWITRVPVPLTSEGEAEGRLQVTDSALPEGWSVYSPLWSPVRTENGALVLRDRDPYDMARVEKTIFRCDAGEVALDLQIDAVEAGGAATFEMQDDVGRTPVRLVFRADGILYVRADGRTDPWTAYPLGEPLTLTLKFDGTAHRYTVRMGDAEKSFSYNASVNDITRFRLMTKERIPGLSTLDSVGKYGTKEQVLPGCEKQTAETVVRLLSARWSVRSEQNEK